MSGAEPRAELLGPYRVLDLTNELRELAGRLLADLGADVIKIEPPGGDPSRWRAPFYGGAPNSERSLAWWASNVNKRSVVLDLSTAEGRRQFLELVRGVDFLLESFVPGYL